MLETLVGLGMGAALVFVLVGAPVLVLSWELRNGRILPPLRVVRAERPRWYWFLVVTHAVLLTLMLVVCGAFVIAGIVSQLSN